MGRLRSLLKGILLLFLIFSALWASARLASQIDQHFFRRRTEALLAEIQSLELRRTPWQVAQTELNQWRAESRFYEPCNEDRCDMEITLDDSAVNYIQRAVFISRFDDYLRWRLKLSYTIGPFAHLAEFLVRGYMRMGGRLAQVKATAGMRDGVVLSKGFSVHIEAHTGPFAADNVRCEGNCIVAVIGGAGTVANIPRRERYAPQLVLHPTYVIDGPDGGLGWFGGISAGGVMFTPDANPADVRRFMQFDFSCLTRWHPCVTRGDIMPSAWKQHLAEEAPH